MDQPGQGKGAQLVAVGQDGQTLGEALGEGQGLLYGQECSLEHA